MAPELTTEPAPTPPAAAAAAPPVKPPWAAKPLPPFPAVALQLMGLLDSDVPVKEVVKLLRVDPALSGEILRVSNSALFGVSRRIDSVSHAVVILGGESVKRLALTAALGRFTRQFMRHPGLRACWDHSLACALVAEELAELLNRPKDSAYTAGLLHDLGRLALLACDAEMYTELLGRVHESAATELERERESFGVDHCAAGEWLARHWNLPDDFVAAIATHHSCDPAENSLAGTIAAADRVADAVGYSAVAWAVTPDLPQALEPLPLADHEAAAERLEEFGKGIADSIALISPQPRGK